MQVLPLVAGSMVAGVCALRGSAGAGVGRVARATLAYYTATTAAAVLLGVLLVVVLQPGAACSFGLSLGELTELDACKEWLSCSQVHVLLLAVTWTSWQTFSLRSGSLWMFGPYPYAAGSSGISHTLTH